MTTVAGILKPGTPNTSASEGVTPAHPRTAHTTKGNTRHSPNQPRARQALREWENLSNRFFNADTPVARIIPFASILP